MSNSLHPHWDTTDDDELPVRITDTSAPQKTKKHAEVVIPRATRSPAAFVGVALFLVAGTALFMGANKLLGQIAADDIEVVITQNGIEPSVITVAPGETIVWKNEAGIPHILRSETLPTEDGTPFNTTAIFPQAEFSYTIPLSATAATHDYISGTAENITGQIIIEEQVSMPEQPQEQMPPVLTQIESSSSSASSVSLSNTIEYANTSDAFEAESSSSASSVSIEAQVTPGVIPQNPNTVGNGTVPLPPRQQPNTPVTQTPLRPAAVTQHMPSTNAQTGMELWVLGVITLASFAGVAWKAARNS